MMNDTDLAAREVFEERAAICEHDGLLTRDEAEKQGLLESARYMHDCLVRTVLRMPFEDRRPFLDSVEKKQGKAAADKLRADVIAEFERRKGWTERD